MKTITISLKDEHINMLEAMELLEAPINLEPFKRDILFKEMILDLDYRFKTAAKREQNSGGNTQISNSTLGTDYVTALGKINKINKYELEIDQDKNTENRKLSVTAYKILEEFRNDIEYLENVVIKYKLFSKDDLTEMKKHPVYDENNFHDLRAYRLFLENRIIEYEFKKDHPYWSSCLQKDLTKEEFEKERESNQDLSDKEKNPTNNIDNQFNN